MPAISLSTVGIIALAVVVGVLGLLFIFRPNFGHEETYIPIQPLLIEIPPGLPNKESSQGFFSYQGLYNKETMCPSPPGTKCKVDGKPDCKVAEICMHYDGDEYGTCVCSIRNDCMQDGVC